MKYTDNYGLKKPETNDYIEIEDLNENADIIDDKLKEHENELDSKETPAGAQAKADQAEQNAKQYTDQQVADIEPPVTSVNNKTGDVTVTKEDVGLGNVINELQATKTEHDQLAADFAAHQAEGAHLPSGIIVMWSGTHTDIPSGWLLCDGTNGTPDLRDRFILGATSESDIGDTGGQHEVTLSVDQIPSHNHSGSTNAAGSHSHGIFLRQMYHYNPNDPPAKVGSATNYDDIGQTDSAGNHSHTFTTNSTGGNQPHENRPAFYKLAFIMKA